MANAAATFAALPTQMARLLAALQDKQGGPAAGDSPAGDTGAGDTEGGESEAGASEAGDTAAE
jgi:hypothetical protein